MSLIVFPAIDLKGGLVVRLAEGDMDRATVYGDDPTHQAMLFPGMSSWVAASGKQRMSSVGSTWACRAW